MRTRSRPNHRSTGRSGSSGDASCGAKLGEPDGVLVFDPSAVPKKGTESVGVQRQWCGRLGKVDNCQVGLYLGYVSRREHALVDVRLYVPQEWATNKKRRQKAGIPKEIRFRTRHELFLEMLDERGPVLPHGWVSGDDELGRCSWFREQLQVRHECYLLAVPSNTTVRDLRVIEPLAAGPGRPKKAPFVRVDRWRENVPATAWETIEVRPGAKGPIEVQAARTLVQAHAEGRVSEVAETLMVFRELQSDGSWKHDYLLSNAPLTTTIREFARVFKAQHRIEECLQRAKGEAGLADYQVRTWEGWHHHQTLSLLATWFLTQETRRGKNPDTGVNGSAGAGADRGGAEPGVGLSSTDPTSSNGEPPPAAKRRSSTLSPSTTQSLTTATA